MTDCAPGPERSINMHSFLCQDLLTDCAPGLIDCAPGLKYLDTPAVVGLSYNTLAAPVSQCPSSDRISDAQLTIAHSIRSDLSVQ